MGARKAEEGLMMVWKLQASENNVWGLQKGTNGQKDRQSTVQLFLLTCKAGSPHFVLYIGGNQGLLKKSINKTCMLPDFALNKCTEP